MRRKANGEHYGSGLLSRSTLVSQGDFRWDARRSRVQAGSPMSLNPGKTIFSCWFCLRTSALGLGVETCHPEPHLTLGGLWAAGAGRWQQQLDFG